MRDQQGGGSNAAGAKRTGRLEFGDWLGRHYAEKDKVVELVSGVCAICRREHGIEIAFQAPSGTTQGLARDLNTAVQQKGDRLWSVTLLLHRRRAENGHMVAPVEVRFLDREIELNLAGNAPRRWQFADESADERQAIRELATQMVETCAGG